MGRGVAGHLVSSLLLPTLPPCLESPASVVSSDVPADDSISNVANEV